MIGNCIAVIEQRAPFDETGKQWVPFCTYAFRKTRHISFFD